MAGNITFSMIKPGAVSRNLVGNILEKMNESGFRFVAMKYTQITRHQAEAFYEVHRGRPFFEGLIEFMTSGPIVAAILQKENAVEEFRNLIGTTDPSKAADGTIRKLFGENVQRNAVHGSDSDENAKREAEFFFSRLERFD